MGVIMFAYISVSVLMLAISAQEGSVAFLHLGGNKMGWLLCANSGSIYFWTAFNHQDLKSSMINATSAIIRLLIKVTIKALLYESIKNKLQGNHDYFLEQSLLEQQQNKMLN